MLDPHEFPGLDALQRAIAAGDIDGIRHQLLALDESEQQVLETRLGRDAVRRMYARARRVRRARPLGRVVVIHGIMGSRLDAVDAAGDTDRIWVNYFRLVAGRIEELRLGLDGEAAKPSYRIRLGGLFPEYLPLITELADRWEVLPFAYDWRGDIDRSAAQLAERIKDWAGGRPTHIVAHSMGGLVSRRFVQLYPEVWKSMADPQELRSGGRLVMLGTPNRGSLSIALVLTGKEKVVRMLELLDVRHDMRSLLEILGTFRGAYQMLPSPRLDVADDRLKLYDTATWGDLPVHAELLAQGRAVQEALDTVIDPGRMLYVAGYDQPTPFRIRVDGPARFSYQETPNGDGRVPHDLGLLDGVRTFWIREAHGDLPRNRAVLDGIHDLLLRGSTTALESVRPARRGVREEPKWQSADEIEPIPAEVAAAALKPVRRGVKEAEPPSPEEAARIEALMLRDYLGTPGTLEAELVRAPREAVTPAAIRAPDAVPELAVEVVWADITRVPGDVYTVGHYELVLPQNAELALDRVVSGRDAPDEQLVLTNLTRRGILRGALGEVHFYPWAGSEARGRVVAVAGMGHPGTFGAPELQRLARNLTWAVTSLPDAETVCTVLIGAGVGNLTIPAAVDGLILGMVDALAPTSRRTEVRLLRIVERELGKARSIHSRLQQLRDLPAVRSRIKLTLRNDVSTGEGGVVGGDYCLALTLAAAASIARQSRPSRSRQALDELLAAVPEPKNFRAEAIRALDKLAGSPTHDVASIAADLTITLGREQERAGSLPTRISFVRDGPTISAAALTDTAVIPERRVPVDDALLSEAISTMIDPDYERVSELSASLARLIVPREFRPLLARDRTIVFEVDRAMAKVHWEMLSNQAEGDGGGDSAPIALRMEVARQLRTTYSPPPSVARVPSWPLRALVIGDPGDPERGDSLPGARREAIAVTELLRAKGVDVVAMIGAPNAPRDGALREIRPAKRLDVLNELMRGGFDLLHYAGHGDFDPKHPQITGWVFQGGLLTSRELERVDLAPSLVVANACLSARTSEATARGTSVAESRTEADLLPGLADEFFKRGVRNYIGTAWEVNDVGAVTFAEVLYGALIPSATQDGGERVTVGQALKRAREALKQEEAKFGALWAAYQHYGDPQHVVAAPSVSEQRRALVESRQSGRSSQGGGARTTSVAKAVASRRASKRKRSASGPGAARRSRVGR